MPRCLPASRTCVQPIAMALDDRGRLWIAEAYSYPIRLPDAEAHDRILIFEDTNGDGKFDKRTVFADKLNLVSGLRLGFGGVWVGAAPYLLFIPDADGDDRPDGPPQILLDGWGYQDTHETLNTFIWGPDGWLYGCHGVFTQSNVGKPGTPDDERQAINCRHLALSSDAARVRGFRPRHQQSLGRRFQRAWPRLFDGLRHPAPVLHDSRRPLRAAGGRAHQSLHLRRHQNHRRSSALRRRRRTARRQRPIGQCRRRPRPCRRDDLSGRRLARRISRQDLHEQHPRPADQHGYADAARDRATSAATGPTFCLSNDSWSQILNLRYGPDGQVYMIDWYDKNACHHGNVDGHDRSNGRIFKVSYGEPKPLTVDLAKESDERLAELMLEKNDWYVRHARRILAERASKGPIKPEAVSTLMKIALENPDETRRLRGMWALHAVRRHRRNLDPQIPGRLEPLRSLLGHPARRRRREPADRGRNSWRLEELAASDPSPIVRLYLASRLQRLPADQRWNTDRRPDRPQRRRRRRTTCPTCIGSPWSRCWIAMPPGHASGRRLADSAVVAVRHAQAGPGGHARGSGTGHLDTRQPKPIRIANW